MKAVVNMTEEKSSEELKINKELHRYSEKKKELIDYLHIKMNELGRPPVKADMKKDKTNSYMKYYRYFGSYKKALAIAGIVNGAKYFADMTTVLKKDLLSDLVRLNKELTCVPTEAEIAEFGRFKMEQYKKYYSSLRNACKHAGLSMKEIGTKPADLFFANDNLLQHLVKISLITGNIPHKIDLKLSKQYSAGLYIKRYGTWKNALTAAGLNKHFDEQEGSLLEEKTVVIKKYNFLHSYIRSCAM